jgi:HK97 family phage portal protein
MGLVSRSLGIQALSLEDPAQPLLPSGAMFEALGLGRSDAGVLVNEQQAMRIATAHACVKIISEDLATLAREIFEEMLDGSMRIAPEHGYWELLHNRPNSRMSPTMFWGALFASAVGWGNGYAWIKRDTGARAEALIPLKPGLTAPCKVRGQFMYGTTQTESGQPVYLDPMNVIHLMGVSFDGLSGLGPITCMNAFGLASAAEKFGAQFFGNGARASGLFTYPGALEDEAQANLTKSLREIATGENALRPMVLEEGLKWQQTTIAPNEAQFLQTRRYQRTEIASLYRVPLHLIGDLERSTNNNIEHQSLDYVRYCLRPWAVKAEQEVNYKLLGGRYCMEHNLHDLQRGDFATQTQGLQTLRNIGVFSTNQCLRALRENAITTEDGGDVRTVQGAMIPLTSLVTDGSEPAEPADPSTTYNSPRDRRVKASYRGLFRDAVGRIAHRGGDADFAKKALQPVVSSLAQAQLAMRFGSVDLTKWELALIGMTVTELAAGADAWQATDAAAIATRVTDAAYAALGKEILSNEA